MSQRDMRIRAKSEGSGNVKEELSTVFEAKALYFISQGEESPSTNLPAVSCCFVMKFLLRVVYWVGIWLCFY